MAEQALPVFASDQDWLDFVAEQIGAKDEGFQVMTAQAADWAMAIREKALGHIEETERDYATFLAAFKAHYDPWREARNQADHATIEKMESLLRPYFDAQKAAGKIPYKRKSFKLPGGGVLGESWHPVQWEHQDAVLLPWAKARDLVRVTEAPRWDEIKKQLQISADGLRAVIVREVIDTTTGEVTRVEDEVPGVRPTQLAGNVFYVEGAKKAGAS